MRLEVLTDLMTEEKELILRVYTDGEYFSKEFQLDKLAKNKRLMAKTVIGIRANKDFDEMEIDVM